ncbi:MAG: hypothetical protein Q4C84_04915 [Bacillota bacterium]|nr:hypothetical protein [Bacillota bacterium]
MDEIGSSTRLMWIFVFIYSFPVLLLLFSTVIWTYNRFKHLAFATYIADIIFTVFILLINVDNLMSRFTRRNFIYDFGLWSIVFLVISVVFMIISISSYRKSKKSSNIFINISTLFCVILYLVLLNTVNI